MNPSDKTEQTLFFKKNAYTELTIDDVDGNGFGIGHIDGFAVFVEGALPGDRLRVRILKTKKHYAYGKTEKILTPSPHRLAPGAAICPVAAHCGGCQWQHCDYQAQLVFKKRIVLSALTRIGHIPDPPVADVLGMAQPYHYRNKAQFPVAPVENGPGIAIGFYAPRSHRMVPVTHCNIQHPSHESLLNTVRAYAVKNNIAPYDEEKHEGLLRHIVIRTTLSGEIMVALVVNGSKLPHENRLAASLAVAGVKTALLNTNTRRGNTVLGERSRVLLGDGYIHERIGSVAYRLSLHSFFQVNPVQAKTLYDTALALGAFTGTETLIDAHAGAGGVSLYAAKAVRFVYGIEIVPDAVSDATHNAALNGLENVRFIQGAAETAVPALLKDGGGWADGPVQADAVMLDPPRKGCEPALIDTLLAARIPKIIYISCDPATLARDIQRLTEGGYVLEKVQPVDLFPMTGKVESVALLTYTR